MIGLIQLKSKSQICDHGPSVAGLMDTPLM